MSLRPTPIILDTSYLVKIGFCHPDFQKLAHYSKTNLIKLYVSHIAWEEWRTHYSDEVLSKVQTLKQEFNQLSRNFILTSLPKRMVTLWDKAEIEDRSRELMTAFATENHITIVPIAVDHAERAWRRYFEVGLPFNPDVLDREIRRKDIPDSWILEAAIDVKREHSSLIALCADKRFTDALSKELTISVFESAQEALDHVEGNAPQVRIVKSEKPRNSANVSSNDCTVLTDTALNAALTDAESRFRVVATKVIGFVSSLGSPTKDQLYAMLEQSDIPIAVSKNVAEQLALRKIILDTGNHYISGNKEAGTEAQVTVEPEIIRLVTGDN